MSTRRFLYGSNAVLSVLLVVAILVLLNYIVDRHSVRVDLTEGQIHSISDQTENVLEGIYNEVEILAFFDESGVDWDEFRDLLDEYTKRSSNLVVRYIDPDKSPGLATKYGVVDFSTVVVKDENREIKLELSNPLTGGIAENAEEQITNALVRLSKNDAKSVYFATGHGERDHRDDLEPKGLGLLYRSIRNDGYNVDGIVLLKDNNLAGGSSVLIMASPKEKLSDQEKETIDNFLNSGGKAIFMVEPKSGYDLVRMLRRYGVMLNDDVVIDPSSKLVGGGDISPIVSEYVPHDITYDYKLLTIYPYTRSIDIDPKRNSLAKLIAKTGEYSWSENNFELFDEGIAEQNESDVAGPVGVVAVAETDRGGRIAVFGGVDFASNRFLDFYGNKDFILNTLNWVAGEENYISIRPRYAKESVITITEDQINKLFGFSVIALPLVIILLGTIVWWRRRGM